MSNGTTGYITHCRHNNIAIHKHKHRIIWNFSGVPLVGRSFTLLCCTHIKIVDAYVYKACSVSYVAHVWSLQFHQIATHYLSCHVAMEVYGMGTMRNLPNPHPIYKLLHPHFRYTMAINSRARVTLVNDGGIIDRLFAIGGEGRRELMRRAGKSYNIHCTNIKRSTKERGVDDPKTLPGYYYRDDGLKLWNAMESYIRPIVDQYYKDDAEVKGDSELQKWADDIHTNGFPGYFGAEDGHGFPEQIDSKETLIELCILIMFTGSAQHAAVNFGQYTLYGYVPNAPTGMRRPPPTKKGADYQDILESLPGKMDSYQSITTAYALSQFSPDEVCIYINYMVARKDKLLRQLHRTAVHGSWQI